jgi:HEAT repeat protein
MANNDGLNEDVPMKRLPLLLVIAFSLPTSAHGYIEGGTPTLGKLANDAVHIVVLQVDKVSREKRAILFNKIADLKGKDPQAQVKHQITDGIHQGQAHTILEWADPGKVAVCFHNGKVCQTCIGIYWYECSVTQAPWWIMTAGKPELAYAYRGSAAKLRDHVTRILTGREAIITALKYDGRQRWESFEAVCSGRPMRGKEWPLWRIRAGLNMPATYHTLTLQQVVGAGAAAPNDVPGLLEALRHDQANIHIEAAQDLALTDPPALAAIPALLAACRDPDPRVRVAAAEAVASIDPNNWDALHLLVRSLRDEAVPVRKAAASSLGNLGPEARAALADLVRSLQDKDPSVRWAAADALGQIGDGAAPAVAALTAALSDKAIRPAVIHALGQIGPRSQAAAPALAQILKEDDAAARWTVASALVRIGGPELPNSVHTLWQIASRDKTGRRGLYEAANVVCASHHAEMLRVLLQAARDPDARELTAAMYFGESLRRLFLSHGKDDLPALKKCLQDPDPAIRSLTAVVLVQARQLAVEDHVAIQVQSLKAADPWVRRIGAQLVARVAVNPDSPEVLDALATLTVALKDSDAGVRAAAAEALKLLHKK